MSFAVLFEPDFADGGSALPPDEVDWSIAYASADVKPERNLFYKIGDQRFAYYPASLADLLHDLLSFGQQLETLGSHAVGMSGYTVLLAEVTEESVVFRDPIPPNTVLDTETPASVRQVLLEAIGRVWWNLMTE